LEPIPIHTYTFRLLPSQDLRLSLDQFVNEHLIQAGCVLACVGSLTRATLRLADGEQHSTFDGKFEIVSLTGTLSISDGEGRTLGGHLVPGCSIYTTAEVVIAVFPQVVYKREYCQQSGYAELVIEDNPTTTDAKDIWNTKDAK
jgi:predicted DNA-binding protein with PD1-like motif